MRIQDLETKTGLDRATIRFYEREGMICPSRSENGYRDYSMEDVNQLLKIKLLRQLDFSLERIKEIQQGSITLSEAMDKQISYLRTKADVTLRACDLCYQLLENGVTYNEINADFYLNMLNNATTGKKFREKVEVEVHPVRRFVARYLDWMLLQCLMLWIVFGFFRLRPAFRVYEILTQVAAVIINIYWEALLIYLLGTTPGKWVMGIRVVSANGDKITWEDSLWRSKLVTQEGLGFRIPIWREIRWYIGYKDYLDGKNLDWEEDTDLVFKQWDWKGKIAAGLCYLVICLGMFGIVLDTSFYPTYRNGQLTLNQFTTNYNSYAREGSGLTIEPESVPMTEKGRFDLISRIEIDYVRQDPAYVLDENGFLERIEYTGHTQHDKDVMANLILAVVGAQKDVKLMELASLKAGTTLNQEMLRPISFDRLNGELLIAGIRVEWTYDDTTSLVTMIIYTP